MSKITLEIDNIGGGTQFFVSGRKRSDDYIFTNPVGRYDKLEYSFDGSKLEEISADLLSINQCADAQVKITITPTKEDLTKAALAIVETVEAERDAAIEAKTAAEQKTKNVEAALIEARALIPAEPDAAEFGRLITEEELQMLGERDQLLAILSSYANDAETPLDVLRRIIQQPRPVSTITPEPEQPAEETPADPGAFDEVARRAHLSKLGKKNLRNVAEKVPGAEAMTEQKDLIEAILLHEAMEAAAEIESQTAETVEPEPSAV